MMYNIKREGRDDLLLGCSLHLPEQAMDWLNRYRARYPQFKFYIVKTEDPGDMVPVQYNARNYPL